ncbi:putative lateral flagellar export/assembly protein LafU [Enterobacterales bacterium CwR94]|nr:putative lateral flagellar export/assembly protein LafU [Enterobacterales bacterium CwR94]
MRSNKHAMTIIKRSSRKSHAGVHTGSWKVAFADFMLALMALFLVLWIVGTVTQEERQEIVAQLNGTSLFDGSSVFDGRDSKPIVHDSGAGSMLVATTQTPDGAEHTDEMAEDLERNDSTAMNEADEAGKGSSTEPLESVLFRSDKELQQLSVMISNIISAYNAQDNLKLEKVPQGLRILIQDDKDRMMFPRGSAVMTPYFEKLLSELAPVFNRLDNQIMITGHTDAAKYRDSAVYNNWNLSGDRALTARRALERGGVEGDRVIQVNAMGSRMLLDTEDPLAARNRRIEIMVLTHSATQSLYEFYGLQGANVVKPIVERIQ